MSRALARIVSCAIFGGACSITLLGSFSLRASDVVTVRPPTDLVVSQVAYGTKNTLEVSWTSAEEYTEVEVLVDAAVVVSVDGAAGTAALTGQTPGVHEIAVRGLAGETASSAVSRSFEVLESSPVLEPVRDLACALFAESGGTLELSWSLGANDWERGVLERAGTVIARIESGETAVSVFAFGQELPVDLSLRFMNLAGYWSEPIVPTCARVLPEFRRGDCDGDAIVTISDSIFALRHIFLGADRWYCDDACDVDDDGRIDVADPIGSLRYLFAGGALPPAPGPSLCGSDPSEDFLGGVCRCPSASL